MLPLGLGEESVIIIAARPFSTWAHASALVAVAQSSVEALVVSCLAHATLAGAGQTAATSSVLTPAQRMECACLQTTASQVRDPFLGHCFFFFSKHHQDRCICNPGWTAPDCSTEISACLSCDLTMAKVCSALERHPSRRSWDAALLHRRWRRLSPALEHV